MTHKDMRERHMVQCTLVHWGLGVVLVTAASDAGASVRCRS